MNIYIENHEEISRITRTVKENGAERQEAADVGVQLDRFDQAHGLPFDAAARAEYKQHLGLPLSRAEKRALHG